MIPRRAHSYHSGPASPGHGPTSTGLAVDSPILSNHSTTYFSLSSNLQNPLAQSSPPRNPPKSQNPPEETVEDPIERVIISAGSYILAFGLEAGAFIIADRRLGTTIAIAAASVFLFTVLLTALACRWLNSVRDLRTAVQGVHTFFLVVCGTEMLKKNPPTIEICALIAVVYVTGWRVFSIQIDTTFCGQTGIKLVLKLDPGLSGAIVAV